LTTHIAGSASGKRAGAGAAPAAQAVADVDKRRAVTAARAAAFNSFFISFSVG
jgi:hypothetical protein